MHPDTPQTPTVPPTPPTTVEVHVPTAPETGAVGKRIMRATGALMLIQIVLRGFGIIEKMILSYFAGTGIGAEAYFTARRIAWSVFEFFDQAIMHSFLPVFVQRMHDDGERMAWRLASTVLNLLIIATVAIAALGIAFAPEVLHLFAPDWFGPGNPDGPALIGTTVQVMRVLLVAMVCLTASSLTYCLLNSYKKFALPASADLALKGTVLIAAAVLMGGLKWGPLALALGFVIGAAAKVGVHLLGLGRPRLTHYRPTVDLRAPGLGQFLLLTLPLLAGDAVSLLRKLMDTRFATTVPGGVASLDYAKALCDVPVAFFPFVFGIALFPFLADIAANGDRDKLRQMLMTATRLMILIFLPLAVSFILLRYPILLGIYGSREFDMDSARLTAAPFVWYACGMLIAALEIIVLQFYFALKNTLLPMIVGMTMVALHIGVAWLGVDVLGWGAAAVAFALLVSKGTKVGLLYALIRGKVGGLEAGRTLLLAGKVLLALLPLIAILLVACHYLPEPGAASGKARKMLALVPFLAAGGVGAAAYLVTLKLLRVDELDLVMRKLRGKLRKEKATA